MAASFAPRRRFGPARVLAKSPAGWRCEPDPPPRRVWDSSPPIAPESAPSLRSPATHTSHTSMESLLRTARSAATGPAAQRPCVLTSCGDLHDPDAQTRRFREDPLLEGSQVEKAIGLFRPLGTHPSGQDRKNSGKTTVRTPTA